MQPHTHASSARSSPARAADASPRCTPAAARRPRHSPSGRPEPTTSCSRLRSPRASPRARSKSSRCSGTAAAIATRSTRRSRAGRPNKPEYVEFVRVPGDLGPGASATRQALLHAAGAAPARAARQGVRHHPPKGVHMLAAQRRSRGARDAARVPQAHGVAEKDFNAAYDSMTVATQPAARRGADAAVRGRGRAADHRERQVHHRRQQAGGATATAVADQRSRRQREESLASLAAALRPPHMLSAFVPQPQGLARFELRAGAAIPGEGDLARSRSSPRRAKRSRSRAS